MIATTAMGADRPRGPYQRQLAAECDSLMQLAVRRPYGWGWDSVAMAVPAGRATPRHVSMQPHDTPAAGLLLLWAGQLLDEPKYTQAAHDTARGIAAAQNAPGNVPLHVIFGPAAGGRDEPSAVPERAATGAGLAMVLSVIESEQPKPEDLTRVAQRAALWLVKQQTDDGGWPTAYQPDPDSRNSLRIVQLNTPDYRDTTYAMLLAASMMDDRAMSAAAEKAITKLLSLRLAQQSIPAPPNATAAGTPEAPMRVPLWSSAYALGGRLDPKLEAFPPGIDLPASRYAIQALLGSYMVTGDKPTGAAMDAAIHSVSELGGPGGIWKKVYLAHPTTAPTTTPGFFDPPVIETRSDFGLPTTIRAIEQLKIVGKDRYEAMLREQFTIRQHLAATICGLTDQPFTLDLPVSKAEIETYLSAHEADYAILQGPIPDDMHTRIQRLHTLLIRAKLEQKQSS